MSSKQSRHMIHLLKLLPPIFGRRRIFPSQFCFLDATCFMSFPFLLFEAEPRTKKQRKDEGPLRNAKISHPIEKERCSARLRDWTVSYLCDWIGLCSFLVHFVCFLGRASEEGGAYSVGVRQRVRWSLFTPLVALLCLGGTKHRNLAATKEEGLRRSVFCTR